MGLVSNHALLGDVEVRFGTVAAHMGRHFLSEQLDITQFAFAVERLFQNGKCVLQLGGILRSVGTLETILREATFDVDVVQGRQSR